MAVNFCDIVMVSKMGWCVAVHHPGKKELENFHVF